MVISFGTVAWGTASVAAQSQYGDLSCSAACVYSLRRSSGYWAAICLACMTRVCWSVNVSALSATLQLRAHSVSNEPRKEQHMDGAMEEKDPPLGCFSDLFPKILVWCIPTPWGQ